MLPQDLPSYDWVQYELSCNRKHCVSVRIDFARQIMVWKESRRWYDNSVHALSRVKMSEIQAALQAFWLEYEPQEENTTEAEVQWLWQFGSNKQTELSVTELRGKGTCGSSYSYLCSLLMAVGARNLVV